MTIAIREACPADDSTDAQSIGVKGGGETQSCSCELGAKPAVESRCPSMLQISKLPSAIKYQFLTLKSRISLLVVVRVTP